MPKVLTEKQVQDYHDQGFVSPIDVMPESEALSFKRRLEEAERDYPEHINAENRNNAHLVFSFLDELAFNPVILGAVEDLIGPDFSLWGTVLFIKEPGCMSMLPGTHKNHIRPHDDTFAENNILTRGQVVKDVDESTAVDLIMRPGQMSLHHGEIVHGSQPNLSNGRRIGYALQSFMSHDIRQQVGENQWLHAQGSRRGDSDVRFLQRPVANMHPDAVALREMANENFTRILYHGSQQVRGY